MDGQSLDVSSEVPLKSMTISEHHNLSGSNSSCSLFSENVNGEVPILASDISRRIEILKVNAEQSRKVHKVNDLGCEGDNVSCISKADGTNFEISGHNVDTCQKNLTGSSVSVTSFCHEGPEKPIVVQSINHGSVGSECVAEEGNKFKGPPEFARETLQSAADISDRSDPSETSALRDEHGAVSPKVESVSPARDTDLLTTSQKCSHDCIDLWKSDAEIDSNQISAVALNNLDQKKQSEMMMTEDLQEPPLQCRPINDKEDSDGLVDVRVCDICGDVGREALLAVCSKCGDGAEHIYCMRIKMDKVPDGDWTCEDCATMAEAQKQKAEEKKIGRALQKTSTNEVPQSSRKSDLSGDNGRVNMGHASLASSRKRPGAIIEVSPSSKKRALDNDVKLLSPSGSYAKAVSPRNANLKTMTKGEVASSSGFNSVRNTLRKAHEMLAGRSSNIESQLQKGSFSKQKFSNSTDLRTERKSEDAHREQKTPKGSATFGAGQRQALTKLMKSKSFTTSSVARIDSPDSKKNMDNDFKIPKVGSKRSITQRSYSFNSKVSQPVSPNFDSSISMAKPAKATPAPAEVKERVAQTDNHHVLKTAGVRKGLERDTIHRAVKRPYDTNGSGLDRKIPGSLADKGRSSGTSGRTSTVSLGQKADRKAAKVEDEHKLKDVKQQLNGMGKVQLNDLPSGATAALAASAHPDVDCVWRGMFSVECNKLPSCYSGLQAHLSTCASPKVFEVASKLPCELTVKEVLQQDIWPVQFSENGGVSEDDIALYFFAEDHESYRRYKRILNCMVLNDLALKANLDGIELLIFHSQVLPARSRRWNNLFFLWGIFRGKRSNCPEDVCAPSPREGIRMRLSENGTSFQTPPILIPAIPREEILRPISENATSPQNPSTHIPTISRPVNMNIPTQVDQGSTAAEAVSGSGSSSQRELQSSVSTKSKCVEGISVNEVDGKTMESALIKIEQHSGDLQSTNEVQKEKMSPDEDQEAKTVEKMQTENTSPGQDPEAKTVEAMQTENTSTDQDPESKTAEAMQTENTSTDQDPEAKTVDATHPSVSGAEISAQSTGGIEGMKDVSPAAGVTHQVEFAFNYTCNGNSSAIDVNVPVQTNGLEGYDGVNGSTICLNSSPSDSGDDGPSAIDVNVPVHTNGLQGHDGVNGSTICLNSSPSDSEGEGPSAIDVNVPVHTNGLQEHNNVNGSTIYLNSSPSDSGGEEPSAIDVNVPVHTNGLLGYEDINGGIISLNSSPSNSGGEGTSTIPMGHRSFNLELPFLSENESANEGDAVMLLDQPNGNADHANFEVDGLMSLDLSLALPSTDPDPVPMMEDLLPEMDDDVDTSLSLSFGGKRA